MDKESEEGEVATKHWESRKSIGKCTTGCVQDPVQPHRNYVTVVYPFGQCTFLYCALYTTYAICWEPLGHSRIHITPFTYYRQHARPSYIYTPLLWQGSGDFWNIDDSEAPWLQNDSKRYCPIPVHYILLGFIWKKTKFLAIPFIYKFLLSDFEILFLQGKMWAPCMMPTGPRE